MNIIEALSARYTCRAFKPEPVSLAAITEILEAANHAPSWGNTQPWNIYVAAGTVLEELRQGFLERFSQGAGGLTDLPLPREWPAAHQQRYISVGKERYALLSKEFSKEAITNLVMDRNYRFFDAPAVIYLCMDRSLTPYSMFDLGALSQSIMLAALEFGLDTAPAIMLVHYPDLIRKALAIPDDQAIVMGIAIGHGDPDNIHNQLRTSRRPLRETASFSGF
jgi:nitroreductase